MGSSANVTVQAALDALAAIDTATDKIAADITAAAARIQALLDQISGLPTTAQVQSIVDAASAEVTKLTPIAAAADGIASTGAVNPVPVPVPPTPTTPPVTPDVPPVISTTPTVPPTPPSVTPVVS